MRRFVRLSLHHDNRLDIMAPSWNRIRESGKQWTHALQIPWHRLQDRPALDNSGSRQIPRIVWQTGPNAFVNRRFATFTESFRSLNPSYEFRFLTDEDAHDYMRDRYQGEDILRIFEGAQFGPMRADIFRYAALQDEGGIYIDISKYLPFPLDDIISESSQAVLTHEAHRIPDDYPIRSDERFPNARHLFVQWCIISRPGHRFLGRVLDNIIRASRDHVNVVYANPGREILKFTATYMWTRSIWDELNSNSIADYEIQGIDFGNHYCRIPEPYILSPLKRHYIRYTNRPILVD